MKKSHLLISCEHGAENLVYSKIRKVKDVKTIEKTLGCYDFIVELESKNEEQLKRVVSEDMRNIEAIRSTVTLLHA